MWTHPAAFILFPGGAAKFGLLSKEQAESSSFAQWLFYCADPWNVQ